MKTSSKQSLLTAPLVGALPLTPPATRAAAVANLRFNASSALLFLPLLTALSDALAARSSSTGR